MVGDNANDYYSVRLLEGRLVARGGFSFEKVDFSDHVAFQRALDDHGFGRIVHLGGQARARYSIERPRACAQMSLVDHLVAPGQYSRHTTRRT